MKLETAASRQGNISDIHYQRWGKFFLLVVVLIMLLQFAFVCHRFRYHALVSGSATTILVPKHSHLRHLAGRLQLAGLIHSPRWFVFIARLHGYGGQLRFGRYYIEPGMTALNLLDHIKQGKGLVEKPFRIGAGWTTAEVLQHLDKDPALRHTLKIHHDLHLEGLLYPNTYKFAWGESDKNVLHYAKLRMQQRLQAAWSHRAQGLPYKKPYDALIVASIVEKEAAAQADREKVAGVLVNRLRRHMRLQADPTVLYGLQEADHTLVTNHDLARNTPYNTYHHRGLPPTPIAMPSQGAIEAALHPAPTDALYYVADGKGGVVFSKTYKQHRVAVKRYHQTIASFQRDNHEHSKVNHH